MRMRKHVPETFQFFDYAGVEQHLEHMAAKGWQLESVSQWAWTYRRAEPARMTYAVTYVPESSDWNPEPTPAERELEEYCAAAGWQRVCQWGKAQIYCTAQTDPVPIETDETLRLTMVRKTMRKSAVPANLFLLAVFIFMYCTQWWSFYRRDPVEFLSGSGIPLTVILLCGMLAIFWDLGYYVWWSRRSEQTVQAGGSCVRVKRSYRRVQHLLLGGTLLSAVWILCSRDGEYLPFMLAYFVGVAVVIAFLYWLRNGLKRRGVSKQVNQTVFLVMDVILVLALTGGLCWGIVKAGVFTRQPAEVYTDLRGWEWEIYHDPLPLRVEDFLEVDATQEGYSCERQHQSSFLVELTEYTQKYYGEEDRPECSYDVLRVRADFLYEHCLHSWKDTSRGLRLAEFGRAYLPEDPEPWGADAVYRLFDAEDAMNLNHWIICKENMIVRFWSSWDMTENMKPAVLERLES